MANRTRLWMQALAVSALMAIIAVAYSRSMISDSSAGSPLVLGAYQAPGPSDARSPCPAFNIMANHGVFPRDGSAINASLIVKAFCQFFGFRSIFTSELVLGAYALGIGDAKAGTIDLTQLRKHNAIEHDASLVRNDFHFGDDFTVNQTLFNQLVAESSDGKCITVKDLGRFRKKRYDYSKATNPDFTFGAKQEFLAFGESSFLLLTTGNESNSAAPIATLEQFLRDERYPDGLKPRVFGVGNAEVAIMSVRIKAAAGLTS